MIAQQIPAADEQLGKIERRALSKLSPVPLQERGERATERALEANHLAGREVLEQSLLVAGSSERVPLQRFERLPQPIALLGQRRLGLDRRAKGGEAIRVEKVLEPHPIQRALAR